MAMDLNDAGPQMVFGVIPDGTFVKLVMAIRPGGLTLPHVSGDPLDAGLFKGSKTSDTVMLDLEFTVQGGPYDKKKIWENWTVAGGSLNEKGVSKGWNMTKSRIRAAIESCLAVDPKDDSQPSRAKRTLPNFKCLDGLFFYAKLRVEPAEPYVDAQGVQKPGSDKNVIDRIVVPGDEEYQALVSGKEVPPKPRQVAHVAKPAPSPAAATASPAWAKPGSPTAAGPTAAPPPPSTATQQPIAAPAGPSWLRQ